MARAVIVVDMLRGFLEVGHPLYCGGASRAVIPKIERLLEQETARGSKIFFLVDTHSPKDKEFQMFPPHCIQGTEECEIIPELAKYPGEIIPKNRYSGFFNTDLEERLKKIDPEKIIICGVCTNICVLHTAADARNRDYDVEVPANCVATFDHEAHQFALKHMEKILGVKIT